MTGPPNPIPTNDLTVSLSNLSFSGENTRRKFQNQVNGFNNSNPAAFWVDPISTSSTNQEPEQDSGFSTETVSDFDFFTLAANPEGSRKLQEMLMEGNPSFTSYVLQKVTSQSSGTPLLYFLMIDRFGCHVFSKLVDSCNKPQLGFLVQKIVENDEVFFYVLTNPQGAKLMKKIIRIVKGTRFSSLIVLRLSDVFNRVMTNQTRSYVVTYCLDWLDVEEITPLYDRAIFYGLDLATHKIGCASLNYVIDRIQEAHREMLLELVSKNAVFLSHDPSGNHVIQKVLELENPVYSSVIGSGLRGHYVTLSMQKWGSHVVEKCLKSRAAMPFGVVDLLTCGGSQLVHIAKDQFGNYVVQTALRVTKERNRSIYLKLVERLREHLGLLRFGFGKSIYDTVVSEMDYVSVV